MNIYATIKQMAEEMQPRLVERRRDFHKFAESGLFEV